MDMILFIYNILLIILYTGSLVQLINLYISKKEKLYLYLSTIFSLYILDNIFIHLTEFFHNFSSIYNLQFMTIPSLKTIIILSIIFIYFKIQENVLQRPLVGLDYIALTLFTVSLLIIPLILDGAIMVWSYYLPYQLITIYLGYHGLKYLKQNPILINENKFMCIYKSILIYTVIFSVLIIIEDTIVIFSFDVYSNILVKINNRNISEDILSIIYSIYTLKYCYKIFNLPSYQSSSNSKSIHLDNSFYNFVEYYNLTKREVEILKLILNNKTNQEISDILYISIGTVKTHIHNIFQKVGVNRRNDLYKIYNDFNFDSLNLQ